MPDRAADVIGLEWARFARWFQKAWEPGQHLSAIGPTGEGKSTLIGGLLSLRRYVIVLDPKGGDPTIAALRYPRLESWPSDRQFTRLLRRDEEAGRASRYVVGPIVHTMEDLPKLRAATAQALRRSFAQGGWTVYVDELQVLADRRMMNLSGDAAKFLVSARSKGLSFVSGFQGPSWVPSEALRQPSWVAVAYTKDTDVVARLAEVTGRSRYEMRGLVRAIPKHGWAIFARNPREPIRVTRPPYLRPRAAA
jgi:hypothetical protein